ncbi:hypothetical protein GOBAR_AA34351 [Gossypium barbadense]|uniref:Disease resistance R13L4/SHOC-2-like LRR domain-containing protein n=1 Tax=Gossypium barbadense TaxID=3634 RepID=A0A2P5W5J0_GOSBA|nr:hypothetical protein GOBAR_AA34351 [Gossypium barbadense]
MLDFSDRLWVIAGTISPSLLKLHHLTSLNFNSNDFNGSLIPEFFGSLKKLKLLDLSNANFRGPIPSLLGNLSMLETLRLGGNGGDVTYRHNFKKMFSVGKLEWLSHLSRLKESRHCDLPSISSSSLSLANSSTSLTYLDLSDNNLPSSAIYPWLFNVSSNLVSLDLSSNQLKGPIPDALGNMMAIQELYLSDNLFILPENQVRGDSGLNEIGKLLDFRVLDLGYNLLNGSISKSLGQLSNLQVLRLAGNYFDGDVISEAHFSDFTNLQELDLSYTSLNLKFNTGWIPPFPLSQIKLCSCKLGPRFPDWLRTKIYFQPGLSYINMSFNQISGTFPNNSVHIIHLDLSSNNFSGPLPRFSLDFMEMGTINLSKNEFTGPVSPICNITGEGFLALFDLSNNLFSGVVPDCFGSFPFLTALNLGDNSFSGSLPRSLGSLISLEMLRLRGNKFSGVLPSSLQNCAKLKFLDLSDNELSGEIREIPEELSSLRELVALNLSRNLFNGKILQKIGHIRQLEVLDLSRNKFSGNIPKSLSELTFLSILDLSYNYLSGKIPISTQLQSFDPSSVSHNRGLFGPPISPNCSMVEPSPGKPAVGAEEDSDEFMKWFYTGMGLGFTVGFWGFCSVVFFKRSWRHSYYRYLDNAKDWVYVTFVLLKARLVRRIKALSTRCD